MRIPAVALLLLLAACSGPDADMRAVAQTPEAAHGPEPHDASSFARDPSETEIMSPDEPDMHPQDPRPGAGGRGAGPLEPDAAQP